MSDPVYKRILIKISGEALAGDKKTGFDFEFISKVCDTINKCTAMGVEVGIVVGGGNFWRGVKDGAGHVERVSADRMGMLATAMNCLAFADVLRQRGGEAKVLTAVDIQGVGERYSTDKAVEYLRSGKVVMFGCGTGSPFFSTDTAAVLRAAEIGADAILLAKNIDGVYSADPKADPRAVKYDSISYDDVLAQHLAVMDSTATSLAMDNDIPVIVFAIAQPDNIVRVLQGEKLGTTVSK
jgi:uridylate kinase